MEVREVDLPGVGKKFAVQTREGERLTVIIHNTGHREIYNFRRGEDFPFHALRLEDEEARKLAAILGGAYFQPALAGSVDLILEQLSIEWVKVGAGSPFADRTIAELELRRRTGASVIAVLREGKAVPNPQPEERVVAGDTLVVVGSREQVDQVLATARGEGG
ncbi:MAG: cation:proton antiporter regulatory subunit [Gemmatimonadetes bacterium]|nr:cation:proton antiporter regulatory subunit [Gemmatimonadota bacterium]